MYLYLFLSHACYMSPFHSHRLFLIAQQVDFFN
jgi:hypothetical protein